jgi:copper chaperone CopZ
MDVNGIWVLGIKLPACQNNSSVFYVKSKNKMKVMKKLVVVLSIMFVGFILTETYANTDGGKKEVKEVVLDCDMNCQNCANAVEKQLSFTKGVKAVKADFEKDQVTVQYVTGKTSPEMLIASLDKIDYKASVCKPNDCKTEKTGCSQPCKQPCKQ